MNIRHGTPSPAARASDAHEPEPNPEKHDDAERDGASPAGHARPGDDTHTPPEAATACTQATDRAASAPRPDPNADARNTRSRAEGTDERTTASTPRAHPTTTCPRTSGSTARTAATHADDGEREPENPTTGAELSNERTGDMTMREQVKKKTEPGG